MSAAPPVLELQGVGRIYRLPGGAVEVLRGVDLTVRAGEFVMLTGPSGSGKSTVLNLCALLDAPSAGRVIFDGEDVSRLTEPAVCAIRGRRVGMVFQRFCLLPHRTALENVLFRFRYARPAPADARARAAAALRAAGLAAQQDRPARLLSAGEMQRVAIARAVVLPPLLLLADEPTGNLDAVAGRNVMETFRALNREGLTIVMATHNEALLSYGSRRVVCGNGLLIADC